VTLKLTLPTGPLRRSYTLSSAPGEAPEITVKRVPGGQGSGWLHDHLNPGDAIEAEVVDGAFTLVQHPWPSYALWGAGSGMTPLISMVRWVAANDLPLDLVLHQTARTRADLLFVDELDACARQLGSRFRWTAHLTSERGHPGHQDVVTFCPDVRDRRVLVCGPVGYRATLRELLAGAGVKVDRRYHEELYGEAALEVPHDAVPGVVRWTRSGTSIRSDGQTTLLQLAERSGLDLPSSCRSGDCGTCRVRQSSGEWVLACHTFPRGDLDVDL